jgi:hypothetical protein
MHAKIVCTLTFVSLLASAASKAETFKRDGFSFDQAPPATWVKVNHIAKTWPKSLGKPDDAWHTWMIDRQINRREAQDQRYAHYAVQALTQQTLSDAAQIQIEFEPNFEKLKMHYVRVWRDNIATDRFDKNAVTLARRESSFETQMYDGYVTALLVLKDVRVGDIVEYAYTISGGNPVLDRRDSHVFLLGWSSAVLATHVRVLAPSSRGLNVWTSADMTTPGVKSTPLGNEFNLDLGPQKEVERDAQTPAWYNDFPRLVVAPKQSWHDVAKWATTLYPVPAALDQNTKILINTWRPLPSDAQRALKALRFVQEEIRYFGTELGENTHRPAEPNIVLQQRFGDCKDKARLLTTLLAELGIPAQAVLVSARRGRAISDEPPSSSAFDHVIVRAKIGGAWQWLDPTLTSQGGDLQQQGEVDYDVGLVVDEQTQNLISMKQATPRDNVYEVREQLSPIADSAEMALTVTTHWQGSWAEGMRRQIATSGLKSIMDDRRERYARTYGELTSMADPQLADDMTTNSIVVTEKLRAKNMWENIGTDKEFIDLYGRAAAEIASVPEDTDRHSPYALPFPARIKHRIDIALPEGWQTHVESDEQTERNASFSFARKISVKKQSLSVEFSAQSLQESVAIKDFPAYTAATRNAVRLLSPRVIIAREVSAEPMDPETRLRELLRKLADEEAKSDA